jgi:hypothetical protein
VENQSRCVGLRSVGKVRIPLQMSYSVGGLVFEDDEVVKGVPEDWSGDADGGISILLWQVLEMWNDRY